MNKFSALTGIPEFTKGLVRELRVRWALEEMGLSYEEVRYPHPVTKKEEYKKKQPFGQIPYFESGDVCMFESGAILLHLALKHKKLLPEDETKRAHVLTWLFVALNTLEPFQFQHFALKDNPEASEGLKKTAKESVETRLKVVADELKEREFFGDSFSIADIVMTQVLKTSHALGLSTPQNLLNYVQKHESRPAFAKAYADHSKLYEVKS